MPVRIVVEGRTAARDAADLAAEIGAQAQLSGLPPGHKGPLEVITAVVTLAGTVVALADTVYGWVERIRRRDESEPPPRVIVVFDRLGSRRVLDDLSPDEFDYLLASEREAEQESGRDSDPGPDPEADSGSAPGPGTTD
ncbi:MULTISPECIES: hypothetical protein [unclassified Streptosporangium]|uniref:hypothetical protein n=1 Tax=Streptosporangium sp. NPDC005286 TaxID=3154463 RepID=UPI0033B8FA26